MKKIIVILFISVLLGCSRGFFDDAFKGGFNDPTLSAPVATRPSGEYFPFSLSFNNPEGLSIKYKIDTSGSDNYKDIDNGLSGNIQINKNCTVSAYSYNEAEVSKIAAFSYKILTSAPTAVKITAPVGSADETRPVLRFDGLFNNTIIWDDTMSGYDLSYYLKFDFNADGVTDYSINNGKSNSLNLTTDQTANLRYNDCMLNMSVDIRDNYGDLIQAGSISKFKYTHKILYAQTPTLELLDSYKAGNNFFIASIGKESGNITLVFMMLDTNYIASINTKKSTALTGIILGVSCAYGTNNGAACFNIESSGIQTVYPVFNIISNASSGDVATGFTGKNSFIEYYNNAYYLIYMDNTNKLVLKKYSEQGVLSETRIIKSDFSIEDSVTSFKYGNGRFIIGVDHSEGGNTLFKSLIYDVNFTGFVEFNFTNGNNMYNYTAVINSSKAGVVWNDGSNNYYFRSMSIVDMALSNILLIDSGTGEKPYICCDDNGFNIIYPKLYESTTTSNELYYVNINSNGVKSTPVRITSDAAIRNSLRIERNVDNYAFWIEDEANVALTRIF